MPEAPRDERPTTGVTPHFFITGNRAAEALDFYQRAFAAEVTSRHPAPDGKRLMHAALRINHGWVMLCDEFHEYGHVIPPPGSVFLHLQVDDADAWYNRALEAGCTVALAISDQFWGDRYGQVTDPFGHTWSIGHTLAAKT